jgi:hypothetical protein
LVVENEKTDNTSRELRNDGLDGDSVSRLTLSDSNQSVLTLYKKFADGSCMHLQVTSNGELLRKYGVFSDNRLLYCIDDVEDIFPVDENKLWDFSIVQFGESKESLGLSGGMLDNFLMGDTRRSVYRLV